MEEKPKEEVNLDELTEIEELEPRTAPGEADLVWQE
jgi:hypothetical protein